MLEHFRASKSTFFGNVANYYDGRSAIFGSVDNEVTAIANLTNRTWVWIESTTTKS